MDDISLSHSESEEEVSSHDENLHTGGDVLSNDDLGPSENLACSSPHPSICSGDFGREVKLKSSGDYNLTDSDKHFLLRHCFVPSPSYAFPTSEISG